MLQRIQSVFLFLGSACCFGLFGTDVAETPAPVVGSPLFADAHYTVFDDPLLLGLFALAGLLLLITIFLFRDRTLQLRLALGAIVLAVAGIAYGVYRGTQDVVIETAEIEWGIALPLLAIVFGGLARRYVRKDERLVRSADRLR